MPRRPLLSLALLSLATSALGACPEDPAFLEADVAGVPDDASAATATPEDTADTALDGDLASDSDATDSGSDAPDASDADATVAPGCGLGCGPSAACVEDRCECAAVSCDAPISTLVTSAIGVGIDAHEQAAVAYVRQTQHDIDLVTWSHDDGWTTAGGIGSFSDESGLAVATDADGDTYVAHLDDDQTLWIAARNADGWSDLNTSRGPCTAAHLVLDPHRGTLVSACVDPDTGTLTLLDFDASQQVLNPRSVDPLVPGTRSSSLVLRVAPSGVTWAAWLGPEEGEERELFMAYLASTSWTTDSAGRFGLPGRMALTIDRENNPHAVLTASDGPDRFIAHAFYSDATHIVWRVLARKTTSQIFGQPLAVAPANGTQIHLVYGESARLVWALVDGDANVDTRVLDLGDAPQSLGLVSNGGGRAQAVFTDESGNLRLWLPHGPTVGD